MSEQSLQRQDSGLSTLTLEILGNLLSRADSAAELSRYLADEVRRITGAYRVILVQCPVVTGSAHRVLTASPEDCAAWAESPALHRFYDISHQTTAVHLWRGGDGSEAATLLRQEGFEQSATIPLRVGSARVGAMLAIGLVDGAQLESALHLVETLSIIAALALRNALLYEQQEQTIQERTRQLRASLEAARIDQQVISSTRDGILVFDRQMRYQLWNPAMERFSGMKAKDVLGRYAPDVFPFLRQTPVMDLFQRALRGEASEPVEFPYSIPQSNRSGWASEAVAPLRNSNGEIVGAIATVRDVTRERRAQEEILAANQNLQAINHAVQVCTATSDMQTLLDRLLEEALSITGLEGGTICLLGAGNILHLAVQREASAETIADLTQNVIHVGECLCGMCARDCRPLILSDRAAVLAFATREATRNEDIHFHAAFPIVGQARCLGVLCVFTRTSRKPAERNLATLEKITGQIALAIQKAQLFEELERELVERRRAEEAQHAARAQAESANRAKDQFIAVLSHELRTPLTPVLAEIQLLRERVLPADLGTSLEMILQNVELEARLIDDLLDATKIARGELRLERVATDAHECLRGAIGICQSQLAAKRQEVMVDLQARSHMLFADPVRLRQVFWNLLGNAIKYTPEGGRIHLHSRNTATGRLEIKVVDSGIGIEPEMIDKVFQPFVQGEQTLSRRFGGLGLGLTIARALAEAHHGTITVSSPGRDRGTVFTVELPVLEGLVPREAAPPPHVDEAVHPLRILLVEDNADTLRVLKHLLRQSHHEVRTAASVQEALQVSAVWNFDLLISDIGLPDGTGWDLMQQLKSSNRTLKALAFSGYATEEDIRKSRAAGFADHLSKPIGIGQLRQSIAKITSA